VRFIGIILILLTGCATGSKFTFEQSSKVKVGMTEAEVLSIMPAPAVKKKRPDDSVAWSWHYDNGFKAITSTIILQGGKVISVPTGKVLTEEEVAAADSEGRQHWKKYEQEQAEQKRLAEEKIAQGYRDAQAVADRAKIEQEEAARCQLIKHLFWFSPFETAMLNKRIQIGMSTDQVKLSWGEPSRFSQSVSTAGISEIWSYSNRDTTVFFTDGLVTSWNYSR
jgi:hypothetical protein